ncbi:hypothetical protein SISNIDRAFT_410778, partial [Sistotremastrum niveocremeum HHB9708]
LFTSTLDWGFVATNQQTIGQIFAYMPQVLQNALGLTADQVKTYALEVYIPANYNGDPSTLLTMFYCYIPTDSVDQLSLELKARNSEFYSASGGIASQLAANVNGNFPVASSSSGSSNGGNSNNTPSLSDSSVGTLAAGTKRRNAIIGVCSAIGGIALLVLGWWIYRNMKIRRESAHRRLSGAQSDMVPASGYGAAEFGVREMSVGADGRRNSFYFAEDSLRGFQDPNRELREEEQMGYNHRLSPQMQQRRPVLPQHISAPILRDNTLNW